MEPSASCPDMHASGQRFALVVLPHLAAARRVAQRYTRNVDDADEVAQEAAVRMLRFIDTYRGGDARSWVMSVARNTALTWLRNRRRHAHEALDEPDHLQAATPVVPLEDLDALRREVDGLPHHFREIVGLRHFRGLSYLEISATLDIPLGTVMSRLARARERLRERL